MGDSSCFEEYKPVLAMVVVQGIYAGLALSAKAAFREGMNPMVFVVYRQAIATLVLAPTAIFARGRTISQLAMGWMPFCLVFGVSFIGITLNQNCYYQGINLATSSMATAMTNLIPAITFVMAACLGMEEVKLSSLRSVAKVLGTIICVGGAICMALFKGTKLVNMEFRPSTSILQSLSSEWVIGCLLLIASDCFWALWLILQVPICKRYLDPLSLSVWMCFLATFQSTIFAVFFKRELADWKISSFIELFACLFAGIFGSGVTVYLQSWSISVKGPLFSALFNPLSTIITIILSVLLLQEVLYIGSLIGAFVAVVGLYIVLWGKAKDQVTGRQSTPRDESKRNPFSAVARWMTAETDDMKETLIPSDDTESHSNIEA